MAGFLRFNDLHIRLIAMSSMVLDHIGYLLFPHCLILRIFGRLAYPLFLWLLVLGYHSSSDPSKYFSRLIKWGMISQLLIFWFFPPLTLNIFFSLALSLIFLRGAWWVFPAFYFCDYQFYSPGVVLALHFWYRRKISFPYLIILVAFASYIFNGWLELFSLFALFLIYYYSGRSSFRLPSWLAYSFYPFHILFILALHYVFSY